MNTLSNEIESLHTQIDKNNQEITDLKMEITSIKKETDIIKDLSSKKSELEKTAIESTYLKESENPQTDQSENEPKQQ